VFIADLHMHSDFSDGKLSIAELVDLHGKRGFGAIAITDHLCEQTHWIGKLARYVGRTLTPRTLPQYLETIARESRRAWNRYRMVVIPGFEYTKNSLDDHRSSHVLGLGVTDWISPDLPPTELARAIRSRGGIAIAAHPVYTRKAEKQSYHLWDNREALRREFDAWEMASGPHLFDEVLRSGLPMIANSDMHRPEQIRSWKTIFKCERDSAAILEAIRKQELEFAFYEAATSGARSLVPLSRPRAGGDFADP